MKIVTQKKNARLVAVMKQRLQHLLVARAQKPFSIAQIVPHVEDPNAPTYRSPPMPLVKFQSSPPAAIELPQTYEVVNSYGMVTYGYGLKATDSGLVVSYVPKTAALPLSRKQMVHRIIYALEKYPIALARGIDLAVVMSRVCAAGPVVGFDIVQGSAYLVGGELYAKILLSKEHAPDDTAHIYTVNVSRAAERWDSYYVACAITPSAAAVEVSIAGTNVRYQIDYEELKSKADAGTTSDVFGFTGDVPGVSLMIVSHITSTDGVITCRVYPFKSPESALYIPYKTSNALVSVDLLGSEMLENVTSGPVGTPTQTENVTPPTLISVDNSVYGLGEFGLDSIVDKSQTRTESSTTTWTPPASEYSTTGQITRVVYTTIPGSRTSVRHTTSTGFATNGFDRPIDSTTDDTLEEQFAARNAEYYWTDKNGNYVSLVVGNAGSITATDTYTYRTQGVLADAGDPLGGYTGLIVTQNTREYVDGAASITYRAVELGRAPKQIATAAVTTNLASSITPVIDVVTDETYADVLLDYEYVYDVKLGKYRAGGVLTTCEGSLSSLLTSGEGALQSGSMPQRRFTSVYSQSVTGSVTFFGSASSLNGSATSASITETTYVFPYSDRLYVMPPPEASSNHTILFAALGSEKHLAVARVHQLAKYALLMLDTQTVDVDDSIEIDNTLFPELAAAKNAVLLLANTAEGWTPELQRAAEAVLRAAVIVEYSTAPVTHISVIAMLAEAKGTVLWVAQPEPLT